ARSSRRATCGTTPTAAQPPWPSSAAPSRASSTWPSSTCLRPTPPMCSVRSATPSRRWPRDRRAGSATRHLRPRRVLVDADVAGKAEHTLAEDVAHDLGRAAFDGVGAHAEEGLLGGRVLHGALGAGHLVGAVQHAFGTEQVEREV